MVSNTLAFKPYCKSNNITPELYFLQDFEYDFNSSMCEPMQLENPFTNLVAVPSCLQGFQMDHLVLSSEINYILPLMNVRISQNNSFKLLDLSYSIFIVDGININMLQISGLYKLRTMKFRHMNIKSRYMFTLKLRRQFTRY